MTNPVQHSTSILGLRGPALALALACALTVATMQSAQAQTFTVLHAFADETDGAHPFSGVAIDRAGTVYGVTYAGGYTGGICGFPYGSAGCGVVFRLVHRGAA